MASLRRTRALGLLLLGSLVALGVWFRGEGWLSVAGPVPGEPAALAPGALGHEPAVGPPSEAPGVRPGLGVAPRSEVQVPEARPWRVRGRVTDVAGAPVRGADVVLAHEERLDRATVRTRTETDADGRFHLSLDPSRDRRGLREAFVSATSPDRGSLSHFPSLDNLEVGPDGAFIANLVLYPVGTLTGRVLDADDRPVPGAEVGIWARWANGGTAMRRFPCAPDGRFTVVGLFGPTSCRAFAPGFEGMGSSLGTVPVGGTLHKDLRMVLRSGRLRLRFTDPERKPVGGLRVTVGDFGDLEEETAPAGTTDPDGLVLLEGLEPHDGVSVRIESDGAPWCLDPSAAPLEVSAAESPPLVSVSLLRGSNVRGTVRATTGELIGAGYPVSLSSPGSTVHTVTNASGRLDFGRPVPARVVRLDGNALRKPYDVEVTPGTCELDVVVDPCVRVEAHVLRSDGAPLCARWPGDPWGIGLLVGLEVVAPNGPEILPLEPVSNEGVFAAWFPTAQIRGSRVAFRLRGPGGRELAGSPSLGRVRTGQTIRVDLRVPADVLATVRARVVVRGSPTPVTHVSVHLTALDVPTRPTRVAFFWGTDRIELPLVTPGRHELHVYDGRGTALRTLTVPETGVLDLGDIEVARR